MYHQQVIHKQRASRGSRTHKELERFDGEAECSYCGFMGVSLFFAFIACLFWRNWKLRKDIKRASKIRKEVSKWFD